MLLVRGFLGSFHGLVEVRKVKERFLRRLLEVELEERPDIPSPFTFGFDIYEELEDSLRVAVSVVAREEVLSLLKEYPQARCVVSEEVAFASMAKEKVGDNHCWCLIAYEDAVSVSLAHRGMVLYSTTIPVMGEELSEGEVELINNTFRYALNLVPELPECCFVSGPKAGWLEGKELLVKPEVVPSIECDIEDVSSFNLIPQDVLQKRRESALLTRLVAGMCAAVLVAGAFDVWQFFKVLSLRREVERRQVEVERAYRLLEKVRELERQAEQKKKLLEEEKTAYSSFGAVKVGYRVYTALRSLGFASVKSMKVEKGRVVVKGGVNASSQAQGFLLFVRLLDELGGEGLKVLSKSYNPAKRTFKVVVDAHYKAE